MSDAVAARWMRWCVAFVWLWTGLGVLHPYYREKGEFYLEPLGLPTWIMWVTCAGEVGLAVWVALRTSSTWLTVLQVATILAFTVILSFSHPEVWFQPQGVLTKNLPIIGLLIAAWLLEREKKSVKAAYYVLVFVMIVFWWSDLLLTWVDKDCYIGGNPLHAIKRVARGCLFLMLQFGLPFLILLGVVLGSTEIITLYSIPLVLLIVILTLLTSWEDPWLWFHPFGPLSKNVALLGASVSLPEIANRYLRP
jgi:hypothetical protein